MSNRLTFSLASLILVCALVLSAVLIPSTAEAADPTFGTASQAPLTFTVDKAIDLIQLPEATDADAGDTITYSLNTPTGVVFTPATRVLSGTPEVVASEQDYILTATSSAGGDTPATLTIKITVLTDVAFPAGTTIEDRRFKVGTAITPFQLPEATDGSGNPLRYALVDAGANSIGNGLSFDANSRFITGVVNEAQVETEYFYRAEDSVDNGYAELSFKLTLVPSSDPVFGPVTISDITGTVGTEITRLQLPTATDADGDAITYALTPDLPAGLDFDSQLRLIEGTPTAPTVDADRTQAAVTYTWTATDADGVAAGHTGNTKTFDINIASASVEPPVDGEDTTPPTFTATAPTTPITIATVVKLTFNEALPADPTLTGNPTAELAKYTVAVAPVAGEDAYNVTITPTPAADLTANVPQTDVTFTVAARDAAGNDIAAGSTFGVTLAARTAPSVANSPPVFREGVPGIKAIVGREMMAQNAVDRAYISRRAAEKTGLLLPSAEDDDNDRITYTLSPDIFNAPSITPGKGVPTSVDLAFDATDWDRKQTLSGTPTAPYKGTITYTADDMQSHPSTADAGRMRKFMLDIMDPVAPGKLEILSATSNYSDDSVTLTWNHLPMRNPYSPGVANDADNADDGGANVYEYEIVVEDPNGNKRTFTTAHVASTSNVQSFTTIENLGGAGPAKVLGVYKFTVAAKNKLEIADTARSMSGAYAHAAKGVPSAIALAKVADPPNQPKPPVVTSNHSAGTITVGWEVPPLAEGNPRPDPTKAAADLVPNAVWWSNGAPITAYNVRQVKIDPTSGAPITSKDHRVSVKDLEDPKDPEHTVGKDDLRAGTYQFRVSAINDAGEGFGSQPTPGSVKQDQSPVFSVGSLPPITVEIGRSLPANLTLPYAIDPNEDAVSYTIAPANTSTPTLASLGITFNVGLRQLSGTIAATAMDGEWTYHYTASDGRNTSYLVQKITVTLPTILIPTASSSSNPIPLGNYTVPAYGFFVLVRDVTGSGTYTPLPSTWVRSGDTSLPDLAWFFGTQPDERGSRTNGGTIALNGPSAGSVAKKDLVFSEVMWGTDSSLAAPVRSQWIEFYNATPTPISLAGYSIQFHRSQVPSGAWANALDIVSNVSAHSIYFPTTDFPGQSGQTNVVDNQGRPGQQRDLVSMYRHLDEVRIQHYHTGNREERDKGIGGWNASQYPTANIQPVHIATPGAHQIVHVTLAKTEPSQRVIISEIGNSGNDAYDWLELHNTSDAEVGINEWELTRVQKDGALGTEHRIVRFPDIKIPANSFVVITASHPENDGNDLAAGIDIRKADADQRNKGVGTKPTNTTAYYSEVSGLKFENNTNRYLYILRNHKDKLGQPGNVEDVVGTLSVEMRGDLLEGFTGYAAHARQLWNTATWPLQGWGARHGDVNNDDGGHGHEDFRAGFVYERQGKNPGINEHNINVRGYTGIGYDRHAAVNLENGGTPGYDRGAIKNAKASDVAGKVTISEIMLATEEGEGPGRVPRATRLPQWIEIYNSSLTNSVNLKNWYIEIQNADSDDLPVTRNLSETVRLTAADVFIQPNQTVIIVSSSGLASDDFPSQRIINLFTTPAYRNTLNLKTRGDSVISQVGFWIQLRDAENNVVDTVGNLGVSRRAGVDPQRRDNFDTAWDLPSLHSVDGHRASLIRIYDSGVARDGLNSVGGPTNPGASWILASDTNFRNVPSLTYYGNHRDFGTPGYRGGGPLPVSLSKFRPERLDDGSIRIVWITESELNNAGFNILRSETRDGEYKQINTKLIAGKGTTSERSTYTFPDTSAKPNVVYYYQIQDVSIDGKVQTLQLSRLKGNVSAAGKLTTTWGELKALQ